MSSTYHPVAPITHQRDVYAQPVTALAFDPVSDILWTGSHTGIVTAFYTARGMRGVAFPVGGDLAVKKIVVGDSSVRALGTSGHGVGSWAKGGMNKWYFRPSAAVMNFSVPSNISPNLAVATALPELLSVNGTTGIAVRQTPTPYLITHVQFSHTLLLSGSQDGYLRTHDMRTAGTGRNDEVGPAESAIKTHVSGIQGLQASGNFVYTIGWGLRQGRPFPDPLVKVYDLRTLRPLPPVAFSAGPTFINVHPKRPSSIIITSSQGLINIVDISNPNGGSEFYQLDTPSAFVTSAAISPTAAYMAFGDTDGVIHLMSAADEEGTVPFNGFDGQPVEWADTPERNPPIDWTDSTPLNSIGMPYYDTQLLSSWNPRFLPTTPTFPPPPKIPPQVLRTMRTNENVSYAALPKEFRGRRNMVVVGSRKDQGRFRSGKSSSASGAELVEPETPTAEYNPEEIPRCYRKVEIIYSKFGVEDFDFDFYNKTQYSGLETHISNSYTNSIVQTMHYSMPIRRLAKSHITTNCQREHCLLCELGFVVRMLEDANGKNCQSSNFCKTIGQLAQANNSIGLIDYGREDADYAHMIQSFHRFLVDHLSSEGNAFPHNPCMIAPSHSVSSSVPGMHSPAAAPITQLLGIDAKNVITCMSCKAVREKENMTHIVDMVYPRRTLSNEPIPITNFASILRNSLIREMTHKATCQTCKQFATFESRRAIPSRDLPPILAVNACVYNEENFRFWMDSKEIFLKPTVEVQGQVDGVDDPEVVLYVLRALVVQIVTKETGSHLVAIIKVPDAHLNIESSSPWYVFNDFVVRNVSEEEALSIPGKWKVPAVFYLERVDTRSRLDFSGLPDELDPTILTRDTSISLNRDKNMIQHECLRYDELPRPGTLVSIDAEFVSMQQEETEYRSDGTKKVLRPARLSLARVSVLRGDGSKKGVPFIDDHIHTSEVIVDYLTEFSGVKFGDLDPHLSPHTLTPLKVAYKKLRLLVDMGCIFVGHGLSKDFRIINIFVPPDQVIDTVDLYFLRARQRRRLSLRFLSWFVLKQNIQTDTHDSIEDARSALMLYKAYQDFEERGVFDEKLEELYRVGREYNWKPPPVEGRSSPPTASTPHTNALVTNTIPQYAMLQHGGLLQSTFSPALGAPYPSSHSSTPVQNTFFSPGSGPMLPGGAMNYGQHQGWRNHTR